mgnify:CR=1 FL=1
MNNLKEYSREEIVKLIKDGKVKAKDLTDSCICPTCFDRENNGVLYGDNTCKIFYEDENFICFLAGNPRANGHTIISTKKHYKDMMEIEDDLCEKMFVLSKKIMNIIKAISKDKLVILVTHENNIANYYSDRIIMVKDGQVINDGEVTNRIELENQTDQKIFLLDLNKENLSNDNLDVDLYTDENSDKSNIQVIIKNNTIYIKSDKKIVNLNESSIKVVNENYKKIVTTQETFDNDTFDTSWYKNTEVKLNPFKKFIGKLGNGFKDYFSRKKGFIAFMIIFMILGGVLAGCLINLIKTITFDTSSIFEDDSGFICSLFLIDDSSLLRKSSIFFVLRSS